MNEQAHPTYKLGAQGVVILRFYGLSNGALADPTSWTLHIQRQHARTRDPVMNYTNASLNVNHVSTGVYYFTTPEFVRNSIWGSGTYFVEADGDGTVEAGAKSWFKVAASPIV